MAIKSCWFAPHAAAAYLLGAERLFANAPTVEIGEVSVGDGESAGTTAMSIAVTVEEGDGATMRFKVTPGDGTAPRAFLRIRK